MKILLTGGCGYIGTMLTPSLLAQGHEVTVVDTLWFGNYLDPHPRLQVIKEDIRNVGKIPMDGIEAVLHLANVANDPDNELSSKLSWEVNCLTTMLLVERAIKHGVRQFIHASSASVYGVKNDLAVTEDVSPVPLTDYNKTKMISERVLLSYSDRILIQCLRPATICGYSPRMRLDLWVNMLTMQALANGRIKVLGGNQIRPNLHVRDMVGICHHLLHLGAKAPGIFNAGFENISLTDIAGLVTKFVPAEIEVTPPNDPRSYGLSSRKLLATGFAPQYKIEDAIREIIAVFRAGKLKMEDRCFNLKVMKHLPNLV